MAELSPFEKILDINNSDNITLISETGEEVIFEQVALIPYNGELREPTMYTLLHPIHADFEEGEVVAYRIEAGEDDYELVEEDNEAILENVYASFLEMVEKQKK